VTQRSDVEVSTPDGTCPCVLVTPDGEGSWPAVILFMDAGGVRPAMVDMASQLAEMGYVVMVPEMYYRSGPYEPFSMPSAFSDEGERKRLFAMISSVTKEAAARDTGAFLDFLSGHPSVRGDKVGTTGYCMGGGLSLNAAGRYPERIVAAASFHGGRLATNDADSPHLVARSITGRVYVAAAENDNSFPPEQAELLSKTLSDAGVDFTLEEYPAAHGFAVPDMPVYDEPAAERHWAALRDLYGAMLTEV
jgi:carboxymethylenebutenolidase